MIWWKIMFFLASCLFLVAGVEEAKSGKDWYRIIVYFIFWAVFILAIIKLPNIL